MGGEVTSMRVVLVINSLGAGGTERSTAVLLPRLRDLGIDPIVVCLLHRDEGDERRVIDEGFDVRFLRAANLAGRVREVRGILRDVRPALVHTAIFEADVIGRLAAAGTGIPVLTSLVNTPYDAARRDDPNVAGWKLGVVRTVDAWSGRSLTAHFHAVTEGVADDAVATLGIPRTRITVVERGRDPAELGERTEQRRSRVRASLDIDHDAEVVFAAGRQEYQKGHVHLLAAVRALAPDRPHLVTLIAGRTGNATTAIDTARREHHLGSRVRLLGHRDDVADLLVAADVFVLPSLYEGTAGAAIEALALELPVVATRVAGTRGVLVDRENALLVPPGDDRRLAAAIAETLDAPELARERAARGRTMFEERFTLDRSARRMADLYAEVAAAPARPRGRRRREEDRR